MILGLTPETLVVQSKPFHDARPEAVEKHVRPFGQLQHDFFGTLLLEIEGDVLLTAVQGDPRTDVRSSHF